MNGLTIASLLIPQEAYLLLIVVAGLLIMVGLKRLGVSLIGFVMLSLFIPPFIEPLLAELPDWAVWLMLAFFGLSLLRLLLGRRIWDNMWGTLLGNLLTALVLGLFRIPFRVARALFGWGPPPGRG
jgi:hypothetical protein